MRRFKEPLPLCLLFLLVPLLVFPEQEEGRLLQTSRGEVAVQIPLGMTAEDAFYEMASLYLEEKYDLEDALKSIADLNSAIDVYVDAVKTSNEAEQSLLNLYNVPKFGFVIGADYEIGDPFPEICAGGSLLIKRWLSLNLVLTTKLRVGLDVSIFF